MAYYGSGAGLRRLAAKLLAGRFIKIVAIGGSVTALGGREPTDDVRPAGRAEGLAGRRRGCACMAHVSHGLPQRSIVGPAPPSLSGSQSYSSLFFQYINTTFPHRRA